MKKNQIIIAVSIATLSFFGSISLAKKLENPKAFPIEVIEFESGEPILKCSPPAQKGAMYELRSIVKTSMQLTQCGQYEASIEYLQEAIEYVSYIAHIQPKPGIQTKLGRCFSRKSCKSRISSQKVTEKVCKATLLGKSWQQIHPKKKPCKNI